MPYEDPNLRFIKRFILLRYLGFPAFVLFCVVVGALCVEAALVLHFCFGL